MKNDLFEKYQSIKTPTELLEFMSNIEYGYLTKSGKIYTINDADYQKSWYDNYILQDKSTILKTGVGNCFDQVELERAWFEDNNYQIKTIYEMVSLNYDNNYPTHTFLVYKDNNKWFWFENSFSKLRGIHKFDTLEELMSYQKDKYLELLEEYQITDIEHKNIIITCYNKPTPNISALEYIEYAVESSSFIVKDNIELYEPRLEDYWYEKKLLSDAATMSYNAFYDVNYDNYDYNTGCIEFNEDRWEKDFIRRKEKGNYFAYIKDNTSNEFVGYLNYHYNSNSKYYECGIVIEASKRKKGYAKTGLQLLKQKALIDGIDYLYDSFEADRIASLKLFSSLGFKVVKQTTWKKGNKDVAGVTVSCKL